MPEIRLEIEGGIRIFINPNDRQMKLDADHLHFWNPENMRSTSIFLHGKTCKIYVGDNQ